MKFDIILPISLFAAVTVIDYLYPKFEKKIKSLLGEETKFGKREVVLLVIVMGLTITVITLLPSRVVQLLYIGFLSYALFSFTYIVLRKWYIAILPPIIFPLFYFVFWNILTFNLFAFAFAGIIILYMGVLFSWKITVIFGALLTIMDVFQVFVTGFMRQLVEKAVFELSLPVVIMLPTFPTEGGIILGLGDIFLSGLLSIQALLKFGRQSGILTALTISVAMFLFEIVEFNSEYFTYFPATIVVLLGWLAGIGVTKLLCRIP